MMTNFRRTAALVAALVLTAASPALADDASAALKAKLASGFAGVTSFRMTMTTPVGYTMLMTWNTGRTKMSMNAGAMAMDMVMADKVLYRRMNGGAWTSVPLESAGPMAQMAHTDPQRQFAEATDLKPLPDKMEGATPVGAFTFTPPQMKTMAAGAKEMPPAVCTYDKTSGRLRTCSTTTPQGDVSITYEGWNDPANVVEIPTVAK